MIFHTLVKNWPSMPIKLCWYGIRLGLCESKNQFIMSDFLYLIAIVLVIGWLLGVFAFSLGGLIHALLVMAVIAVTFRLIRGRP